MRENEIILICPTHETIQHFLFLSIEKKFLGVNLIIGHPTHKILSTVHLLYASLFNHYFRYCLVLIATPFQMLIPNFPLFLLFTNTAHHRSQISWAYVHKKRLASLVPVQDGMHCKVQVAAQRTATSCWAGCRRHHAVHSWWWQTTQWRSVWMCLGIPRSPAMQWPLFQVNISSLEN